MAIDVNPEDILGVFANEEEQKKGKPKKPAKTYTILIQYYVKVDDITMRRTRQEVVPAAEGIALEKMLNKRQKERLKIAKESGQKMPANEEYTPRVFMVQGRPVTMDDIMKVQKKGGV